jgi:hypothetical protein
MYRFPKLISMYGTGKYLIDGIDEAVRALEGDSVGLHEGQYIADTIVPSAAGQYEYKELCELCGEPKENWQDADGEWDYEGILYDLFPAVAADIRSYVFTKLGYVLPLRYGLNVAQDEGIYLYVTDSWYEGE